MAAVGVGVQVVRVDVEGDQADGIKGRRENDGHVIGGADADGRHVGSGAGAHVRDAVLEGEEAQRTGKHCWTSCCVRLLLQESVCMLRQGCWALCDPAVCALHLQDSLPDLRHHVVVVKALQQPESVASSCKRMRPLASPWIRGQCGLGEKVMAVKCLETRLAKNTKPTRIRVMNHSPLISSCT